MKHLGWACSVAFLAFVSFGSSACKRADPMGAQMAGENAKAAPVAAEPPIAAAGERIAAPGEVAAPAAAPSTVGGAKDTSFSVTLLQPPDVAGGTETVATVKVKPGAGYKMNHEYPTKLTLSPVDGVTPAKATLLKADAAKFDNHEVAFNVKLTPAKAGTYTVRGTAAFAVCTESTCDPKTAKIAINLVAK